MPALKTLYEDHSTVHDLLKGVTRIGRSLENEIRIALPVVSKLHATVTCDESGCVLQNHSSNHTFLNEDKIVSVVKLNHGDKIRVANVTMIFLASTPDESSGITSGREPVRTILSDHYEDPEASLRRTAVPLTFPTRKVTVSHRCDISDQKIRSSVLLDEQSITTLISRDAGKAISQTLKVMKVLEMAQGLPGGDLVAENLRQCFPSADEVVILTCGPSSATDLSIWGASEHQGRPVVVCADVVQRVASQLECLLISDLWREVREDKPALSKMGCISLMCVPIRSADGICRGVVQLLASKPTPDFESEDLGRLAFLAQLLTMVIRPTTGGSSPAC